MIPMQRRRQFSPLIGFLLIAVVLNLKSRYGVNFAIYATGGLLLAALTLHAYRIHGLPRPGRCPACDYDLTGNTTGICPECGARSSPPPSDGTRL
jgi:hypothetical protein